MRRLLLVLLITVLTLGPASAQAPGKVYRVGILTHGFVPDPNDGPYLRAVESARQFGFEVGRNAEVHWGAAEGDNARLPMLARGLVEKSADVIVAIGDGAAKAVKDATTQIPVVMVSADPVGNGLVESLARPGGNLTGVVVYGSVADLKRVEMLAEYLGRGKKIAYLIDGTVGPNAIQKVEQAAASLSVNLVVFHANGPSEYDAAFRAMQDAAVDALLFGSSLNFLLHRGDLVARASAARLPTMCHWREMALAGCLLTFGTNLEWVFGRVVDYVIRIVGFGQKPGELAIEQASKLELIINMKTARALGTTIPDRLAARADEMID
jgi:putative ABC transport system substrate-binding protein